LTFVKPRNQIARGNAYDPISLLDRDGRQVRGKLEYSPLIILLTMVRRLTAGIGAVFGTVV